MQTPENVGLMLLRFCFRLFPASVQGAPGSSGQLVWVGVGAGPVGEEEMLRVRQAWFFGAPNQLAFWGIPLALAIS